MLYTMNVLRHLIHSDTFIPMAERLHIFMDPQEPVKQEPVKQEPVTQEPVKQSDLVPQIIIVDGKKPKEKEDEDDDMETIDADSIDEDNTVDFSMFEDEKKPVIDDFPKEFTQEVDPNEFNFIEPTELLPIQEKVLKSLNEQIEKTSTIAYNNMINSKTYTADELNKFKDYLNKSVNLIIHVNLDLRMTHLCQDLYYRSQFETGTSGGTLSRSQRHAWESSLFAKMYDTCTDFERVKYGCLNFLCSPNGISSASQYGQSYLVLKKDFRDRVTFTYGDSGNGWTPDHLSTFKHPYVAISKMSSQLITSMKKIINGEIKYEDYYDRNYIEAQIHSSIQLNSDVECLCVSVQHKSEPQIVQLLEIFKTNYGCPYYWIDEMKATMDGKPIVPITLNKSKN